MASSAWELHVHNKQIKRLASFMTHSVPFLTLLFSNFNSQILSETCIIATPGIKLQNPQQCTHPVKHLFFSWHHVLPWFPITMDHSLHFIHTTKQLPCLISHIWSPSKWIIIMGNSQKPDHYVRTKLPVKMRSQDRTKLYKCTNFITHYYLITQPVIVG